MFTSKEQSIINLDYFKVCMCGSDACELESQNGDRWLIVKKQHKVSRGQAHHVKQFNYTYMVYHRHAADEGFHFHAELASMLDVALEVIDHDDYRLKRKGRTYFDTVLANYQNVELQE